MKGLIGPVALAMCLLAPMHPASQGPDGLSRQSAAGAKAGVWEGELDDPRRPLVVTVDFDRARASISGGDPIPISNAEIAPDGVVISFDVLLGGQIVHFEGRPAGDGVVGTARGSAREFPFVLTRLPATRPDVPRTTAWAEDLDAVERRFLRYDRSFTPVARDAAVRRLDTLRRSVPNRTDQQILVELARIVASADNAHTRLYFVRNRTEVRRLPIRGWWFGNEFRIVRASADHRDLLGCRVVRIGRVDTDSAYRSLRDLKAGNESWQRYMSAYYLTSPDVLAGADLTPAPDRTVLDLTCDAGAKRVELSALPLQRSNTAVEAWWDLAPDHPGAGRLQPALPTARAPRSLQRTQDNYWFEYLVSLDALYVQYNRAQPIATDPMPAFAERVAQTIADRRPRACIIDVRFNTGGDFGTGTPLVERIAPLCRRLHVFILTGRATFSAGITHAAQWRQSVGGTIVGEPVGDRLDYWSEGGNLVLPHSGLTVHYANAFHRYSTLDYPDRKPYFAEFHVPSLAPDIPVQPSWRDYISGRDVALDVVAAELAR